MPNDLRHFMYILKIKIFLHICFKCECIFFSAVLINIFCWFIFCNENKDTRDNEPGVPPHLDTIEKQHEKYYIKLPHSSLSLPVESFTAATQ